MDNMPPNGTSDHGAEIRKLWRCIQRLELELQNSPGVISTEVATKAAADTLALSLTSSRIIDVIADETQGGIRATYYFNGSTLQEIFLL